MPIAAARSPAAIFFASVSILLISGDVILAARRPHVRHHETHHYAPAEVIEGLPDHTNPVDSAALKCSSCKVLTTEVWERLHALAKKRNGRPVHHEQVDVIEDMCKAVKNQYGLLMRNNKPTTEFSKDPRYSTVKGQWIVPYLEGRCGKILASHEEQILEKYRHVRTLNDFLKIICQRLDRSCQGEDFDSTGDL